MPNHDPTIEVMDKDPCLGCGVVNWVSNGTVIWCFGCGLLKGWAVPAKEDKKDA